MITPWTAYELAWAQQAHASGLKYREIAAHLSRTEKSVKAKLLPAYSREARKKVREGDSAIVSLGEREGYKRNALASVWHLIDLKRAGHSPTCTELRIEGEAYSTRRFAPAPTASSIGSPAAMCSEA